MKIIRLLSLLCLFCCFTATAQEHAVSQVTVVGEGVVKVVPDMVLLNANVQTQGMNAEAVKKENDQVLSQILKFLKAEGIDKKHIQTSYINLSKHTVPDINRTTYYANQSLAILIKDLSKYEQIVSGLLERGLNEINGIQFQSSEMEKHLETARIRAIANAKEKAQILAQALGQSIGAAYKITELTANQFEPMFRAEAMKAADFSGEQTLAPGEKNFSEKVQVSFYLYHE